MRAAYPQGPRLPRAAASVAVLLVLAVALWWTPVQQALVGPVARAEAFVALTICRNLPAVSARVPISDLVRGRVPVTTHTAAQVADLATPFIPHYARGWRLEVAAIALAASAVLAIALVPALGAALALASLAAFVSLYGLNLEGYTLMTVAGIGHWWRAISAWDAAMIVRLLLAPAAFMLVAAWSIWTLATWLRPRAARPEVPVHSGA